MKTKNKEVLKTGLQILIVVFLFVFACLSFFPRLSFFSKRGFNFYAVTSGSMEPAIKTGSLIYSGPFSLDKLGKGDIITFALKKDGKELIVTHRINSMVRNRRIEIPINSKKGTKSTTTITYDITTKGDANSSPDISKLNAGDILGKYVFSVPYLGYATTFSHTFPGFILMVIIPASILIFWEIFSLINFFKGYYEKKAEEKYATMKAEFEKSSKVSKKPKK